MLWIDLKGPGDEPQAVLQETWRWGHLNLAGIRHEVLVPVFSTEDIV
jgi:hypothetical protein